MSAVLYSLRDGPKVQKYRAFMADFNYPDSIVDEALRVAIEHVEYCRSRNIMCTDIAEAMNRPEIAKFHRESKRRKRIIIAAIAAEWMLLQGRVTAPPEQRQFEKHRQQLAMAELRA